MPRTPMPRTPMSRMHTPSFIVEPPLRTADEPAEAGRVVAGMAVRARRAVRYALKPSPLGDDDSQGIIA
jgi:hypothetical protein